MSGHWGLHIKSCKGQIFSSSAEEWRREARVRQGEHQENAEVVLVKKVIFLNEPPRRFAAPRLNQGGEFA